MPGTGCMAQAGCNTAGAVVGTGLEHKEEHDMQWEDTEKEPVADKLWFVGTGRPVEAAALFGFPDCCLVCYP